MLFKALLLIILTLFFPTRGWSQTATESNSDLPELDIPSEIRENSPVLEKWLEEIPNVLEDINHDPSFPTRLRFGYSQFPSSGDIGGINIGIEDVFIGGTNFTINGDYQVSWNGDRQAGGVDLRYYILPLGLYLNISPVVGYRYLETDEYTTDGLNVGFRVILVLSRGGGADISFTQTFVSPGDVDNEVGITTFSFGYAITKQLRISTDIQNQNSRFEQDRRVGINLELML